MKKEKLEKKIAVTAEDVPSRITPSSYPEPFANKMSLRVKKQLGDFFHLKNFGVNLTRLYPGGQSALLHRHKKQDEFIYVLQGNPTLVTDVGEVDLRSGMCSGFPAKGVAHHLINKTNKDVVYLEIGDRMEGDEASYPEDDLQAKLDEAGQWQFLHKDGSSY